MKSKGLSKSDNDSTPSSSSVNEDSIAKAISSPVEAIITLPINDSLQGSNTRRKKPAKPGSTDYSRLLSTIYGIILVLIGILFPMAEALNDEWLDTIYEMIYIVYTLSLSVVCIFYLQWLHIAHRRDNNHGNATSRRPSVSNSHQHNLQQRRSSVAPDFMVRQTKHGILIGDAQEEQDETPRYHAKSNQAVSFSTPETSARNISRQRLYKSEGSKVTANSGISMKLRFGSTMTMTSTVGSNTHDSYGLDHNHKVSSMDEDDHDDKLSDYTNTNNEDQDTQDGSAEAWIDLSKLGSVFSHEGSSLYLRMGELIFTIGNVIYIALEIEYQFDPVTAKCSGVYSWTFFFRLVFVLLQTFFLFKNRTMETHEHGAIARFALMHLIATNLSVWFRTLCNEIMNEYAHFTPQISSNSSLSEDCEKNAMLYDLMPYLFAFVLEYSLIAMGTLTIMYSEVDSENDEQTSLLRGLRNLFKVHSLEKSALTAYDHENLQGETDMLSTFNKSNRGLFAGIVVLTGGIIVIIMSFLGTLGEKTLIYYSADCTLSSLMLLGTILAMVNIHQLSYIARPVSVDDILLVISMSGAVLYEISVMMTAGNFISHYATNDNQDSTTGNQENNSLFLSNDESNPKLSTEILILCSSMIACTQSILQLLLVISGLRRYPSKHLHLINMPGRGVITFLIIANVTVWIFRSCLVKGLPSGVQTEYYGNITWLLLLNINLPLLLFYRFHSSACLADIWHTAYTSPFIHTANQKSHDQQNTGYNSGTSGATTYDPSVVKSTNNNDAGIRNPGFNTLIRSYSMSHLSPPSNTSVQRVSSGVSARSTRNFQHKLPHIDDVENVEDIENEFRSMSYGEMVF